MASSLETVGYPCPPLLVRFLLRENEHMIDKIKRYSPRIVSSCGAILLCMTHSAARKHRTYIIGMVRMGFPVGSGGTKHYIVIPGIWGSRSQGCVLSKQISCESRHGVVQGQTPAHITITIYLIYAFLKTPGLTAIFAHI